MGATDARVSPADRVMSTDDPELEVTLASGARVPVMNDNEAAYLTERAHRYSEDFALTNVSDQQTLDNILVFEMLCYRMATWLGQGHDYKGRGLDTYSMTRDLEKYNLRVAVMKRFLGIDKPTREREKGEGSVEQRWRNLVERAGYFAVFRNEQAVRAVSLFMSLLGLVREHKNADDDERRALRVTAEDIIEWIEEVAGPEMERIDHRFRTEGPNAQRLWIRDNQ